MTIFNLPPVGPDDTVSVNLFTEKGDDSPEAQSSAADRINDGERERLGRWLYERVYASQTFDPPWDKIGNELREAFRADADAFAAVFVPSCMRALLATTPQPAKSTIPPNSTTFPQDGLRVSYESWPIWSQTGLQLLPARSTMRPWAHETGATGRRC